MMLKNKKFLMLASAAIIALPVTIVHATQTNLNATAVFMAAITLTPTTMDFSNIDFSAAPSAGADIVTLDPDGTITYGGVFSAGTGASSAPGNVNVVGTYGQVLEVSCDATGILAEAGGGTIELDNIVVAPESSPGTPTACAGVGVAPMTFTLTNGTDDDIKVGGRLDGSNTAGFVAGSYSTANGGGDNVLIEVVYQ